MTNIRLFAVISVSVVLTALVMGAITRPAHADTPREPACKIIATGGKMEAGVQSFMAEQLAAGKTNFVSPVGSMLCAW